MRTIVAVLIVFIGFGGYAQQITENTGLYVRVFNLKKRKIARGKFVRVTDSSMVILERKEYRTVLVSDIGLIKTKRSPGHNVAVGAGTGAFAFGVLGMASGEDSSFWFSKEEGAAAGVIFGGVVGAGIGGFSCAFKKVSKFQIDGDSQKWKSFTDFITDGGSLSKTK